VRFAPKFCGAGCGPEYHYPLRTKTSSVERIHERILAKIPTKIKLPLNKNVCAGRFQQTPASLLHIKIHGSGPTQTDIHHPVMICHGDENVMSPRPVIIADHAAVLP